MKNAFVNLSVCLAFVVARCLVPTPAGESYFKDPNKKDVHRYIVFSDTHFFGAHGLNDLPLTYAPDTFYIGDIYDLKNADKKDVARVESAVKDLRQRAAKRYVRGNHELDAFGKGQTDEDYYVTAGGILFTHGHYKICCSAEEVAKWESAKPGAGTFKRMGRKLLEGILDKPDRPKREAVASASQMVVRHNKAHPIDPCHTIVFGHTHVKKLFVDTVDGIRVINVPMGVTELDL